jgi:50S ribosomal protein L16 3-hydroxylase
MTNTLLGGLSAEEFLAEYWQKKPLLVRQAVPGFTGVVTDELFSSPATRTSSPATSPTTTRLGGHPRPPEGRRPAQQEAPWTVLVQGLNLFCPDGDALLHRFDFIPQARLDDLMVSYAVDGGGVGPHFDNYDVFLLQGIGQRRWLISNQDDRSLIEDARSRSSRISARARLGADPGDMLYLPPHWAHNGIAIGECTTYSIGFRSPPTRSSPSSSWATCRTPSSSTASTPTPTCAARPTRPRSATP